MQDPELGTPSPKQEPEARRRQQSRSRAGHAVAQARSRAQSPPAVKIQSPAADRRQDPELVTLSRLLVVFRQYCSCYHIFASIFLYLLSIFAIRNISLNCLDLLSIFAIRGK